MRIRACFVALVLAGLPGLAMAEGCRFGDHGDTAMSCADGTAWDAASGRCVTSASS